MGAVAPSHEAAQAADEQVCDTWTGDERRLGNSRFPAGSHGSIRNTWSGGEDRRVSESFEALSESSCSEASSVDSGFHDDGSAGCCGLSDATPQTRRFGFTKTESGKDFMMPVPQDIFGACIVGHVMAMKGKWSMVESVVAWLRVFTALGFQAYITHVLHTYVNGNSARQYFGADGLDSRRDRLDECASGEDPLDPQRDESLIALCWMMPGGFLWFVVVFLWSSQILREMSEILNLAGAIVFMDTIKGNRVTGDGEDGTERRSGLVILGLSIREKFVFISFMVIPQMVISFVLWRVGCEFLSLAVDITTVVLKMFAVRLVLDLDELLFQALLSSRNVKRVKRAKVADPHYRVPACFSEIIRIVLVLLAVFARYLETPELIEFHETCWASVTDCSNQCSTAFPFCSSTWNKEALKFSFFG
eukprot:TRINITY_DN32255_c0_g1_i1.p1 TRINITY_DN32255_c0_g1~~TRINITY_DN32255_c0_g1_i1.p1  ORF type:complete len:419 (-),score=75.86 TRINITY_DN32255_c0_g1_i1:125-1381(-)